MEEYPSSEGVRLEQRVSHAEITTLTKAGVLEGNVVALERERRQVQGECWTEPSVANLVVPGPQVSTQWLLMMPKCSELSLLPLEGKYLFSKHMQEADMADVPLHESEGG